MAGHGDIEHDVSDLAGAQQSQKTGLILGLSRLWVVVIGIGFTTVLLLLFLLSFLYYWIFVSSAPGAPASSRKFSRLLSLIPARPAAGQQQQQHSDPMTVLKDITEVVVVDGNHHSSTEIMTRIKAPAHEFAHSEGHLLPGMDVVDAETHVVTFAYSDAEVSPNFESVRLHAKKARGGQFLAQHDHLMWPELEAGEEKRLIGSASTVHKQSIRGANSAEMSTSFLSGQDDTRATLSGPAYRAVPYLVGWGRSYTLNELKAATNHFADTNAVGEGGYGIVYQGLLSDGSRIAVKTLLINSGQAEKDFGREVETIGRIRHKNLVALLGYCTEGSHRILVYEYVDNGNLDQWLHGPLGAKDPIPWDRRITILTGIAKGLSYLHEDLEPRVVHRDVTATNVLLDSSWNAKLSDFGLAKLLDGGRSHVTTRVMGTFGYVAPEYASTGLLTERSDVYSFGVLMMQVITGRNAVDYGRPAGEVNVVDWMKAMVGSRRTEEVADPRLLAQGPPSSRALKRALLVALRCVDPDAQRRPRMGRVLYMLEADDFSFHRTPSSSAPADHRIPTSTHY